MTQSFTDHFAAELAGLKQAGLYKTERIIPSKQAGSAALAGGRKFVNLYANNYLGLSDNPDLIETGCTALE